MEAHVNRSNQLRFKWGSIFADELNYDNFKHQESLLILLNLGIIASVALIPFFFRSFLGTPSGTIYLVLGIRAIEQAGELLWLNKQGTHLTPKGIFLYSRASVWIHLGFAFLVAAMGTEEDDHYRILMVLPVITAGFRFSLWGLLGVVAASGILSFLEVWIYFRKNPPAETSELFEAFTAGLIYLLVGLVVYYLTAQSRKDRQELRDSLIELQRTKDQLVQEEKLAAIGRLSTAIAHEIRNPVAMIASSVAMVKKQDFKDVLQQEICDIVGREASRLEKLSSDFLTYSREIKPEKKNTSIGTLVGYISEVVRARCEEAQVGIEVEVPEDRLAHIDPFQIQQALLNLTLNAIDAAPKGTIVRVGSVCHENGELILFVENEGEAIAPDVVHKIFEPFFTIKEGGTGLGLPISLSIVKAHGGTLYLKENRTGVLRFELSLPKAVTRDNTSVLHEEIDHGSDSDCG